MEKVEFGYEIEKERWKEAAENIWDLGQILAPQLLRANRDGRGAEDVEDLMADITLARTALEYVAEFAADKCRFIPIRGNKSGGK